MKISAGLLCIFLMCAPLAHGANALKEAAHILQGKIALLCGMGLGTKLSFDAQGSPLVTYAIGPFAYSAVRIEEVHVSHNALELKCERLVMIYTGASQTPTLSGLRVVSLKEPVEITIAADQKRPFALNAAIERVFAFSPEAAFAGKSATNQKSALFSLGSTAPIEPSCTSGHPIPNTAPATQSIPPGTTLPELVYSVTPKYPARIGRTSHAQGVCVLSLIVDTNRLPEHIRIVRPLDPDLDTNAVIAVSQYRFKPGRRQGKPVRVPMKIDVNFHLW